MGNKGPHLSRRQLVTWLACAGVFSLTDSLLARAGLAQRDASERAGIAEVSPALHRIHKWDSSNGDTWDPFWADDDDLYAFNCDGRGFGRTAMNLACNKLSGNAPSSLAGLQVNPMMEYGKAGEKGPDDATWKACGQECIDGVFYAFVARNVYGSDSGDPLMRQLAGNSSLIKSEDRGITWQRSAQENYNRPLWPGRAFGAPFFVHYGRNGGHVTKDRATEYVYACSTNGFWNDGDQLILARVRRSHLRRLSSSDWQYYAGGDGINSRNWSAVIGDASPILRRPAKCGQTPITWIPHSGIYLLVSWYNTSRMTKWFEPNQMRYDFFQAPHPWGPWSLVSSFTDDFLGPGFHMYGPSLCARFQRPVGADTEISLFTSGCPFNDVPEAPYKLWRIPLRLRSSPLPPSRFVPASDSRIHYSGLWFAWTTLAGGAEAQLPRATETRDSAAKLHFTGTGIEYCANKAQGQGTVQIFLDGKYRETVSLKVDEFPVLLGIPVFSQHRLPTGPHTIRVAYSGGPRINVQGFRIYS
jgi:hypothetical protein